MTEVATAQILLTALENQEQMTALHSSRVNKIALNIGRLMKISAYDFKCLAWGTLLHDVGKLAINNAILLKEGSLTNEEYEMIKQHPLLGYDMLKHTISRDISAIVLYHHERFDGKGYPCGLAGTQIPILARICSVADTFEAMTSDRPYRRSIPINKALEEMIRCSGTQFDPVIVDQLFKVLRN